jgi:broad specificity phosphatase PhoE
MSRLFFVRHAQASFLEANYDRLSPRGEQQAALLGAYWARHKLKFNRVCTGPCVRQIETSRIVRDSMLGAGLSFPEPIWLPEFDEYQGEAVMNDGLPQLVERESTIRDLYEAYDQSSEPADRYLAFQRLFEAVITIWVNGEIALDGVEPWSDFCGRVNRGISSFLSAGSSREQVAIFSSGGPTSVAVQRALALTPLKTVQLSWMIRNCAYSEFVYSSDRFSLSAFNAIPHIDDETMRTYR